MLSLNKVSFEKARQFLLDEARPLERAQFEYHFGSGTAESVLTELQKFQNDDGGFGHAIEPDIRMPNSSPFATSVAFQVLRELDVVGDSQIVRDGIEYLERTFDRRIGGWDPIGPQGDDFPRAPWWDYQPIDGELDILKRSNPGAEIVGYLNLYSQSARKDFVDEVTALAVEWFDELRDDMEFHAMMCFMRLAEMAPKDVADHLVAKLQRGMRLVVGSDAQAWRAYSARPLWFAPRPDSLLANELVKSVQAQLDFEIGTQDDDGSWKPVWSYGDREIELGSASKEWAGYLTLRNLLAFKAWGRM